MTHPLHRRIPRPTGAGLLTALLVLLPTAACSDASAGAEEAAGTPEASSSEANVGRDVRDLVAALTPLSAEAPPVERNEWFLRRRRMLERLRGMGPAWGEEALRVFHERPDTYPEVRSGLLDVAAHTWGEGSTDLLAELVTEFGPHLHLRTKACELLAVAAPRRAVDVLGPLLEEAPSGRTYPPGDKMLEAWDRAARALELDRAPLLCALATDTNREHDLRHRATRLLGTFESRQGRQALELLMVESSGNSYIRRIATQSLAKTVPPEELCPLVTTILERESDLAFQVFLDNVLMEHCR